MADTGSLGLLKFNLGRVPASVVPPRSWRRAAWFAVGAATSVVVALAIAAYLLVGPPRRIAEIDSMPAYPSFPTAASATTGADGAAVPTTGSPGTWTAAAQAGSQAPPAPAAPLPVPGTTKPTRTGPVSPIVVTTVTGGKPVVDPQALVTLANQFYGAVITNANAALDLTADTLRAGGSALLQRRYDGVSGIQVKAITVDPSRGTAVSLLQLSREDGSTTLEQRTLLFSLTTSPKIINER